MNMKIWSTPEGFGYLHCRLFILHLIGTSLCYFLFFPLFLFWFQKRLTMNPINELELLTVQNRKNTFNLICNIDRDTSIHHIRFNLHSLDAVGRTSMHCLRPPWVLEKPGPRFMWSCLSKIVFHLKSREHIKRTIGCDAVQHLLFFIPTYKNQNLFTNSFEGTQISYCCAFRKMLQL